MSLFSSLFAGQQQQQPQQPAQGGLFSSQNKFATAAAVVAAPAAAAGDGGSGKKRRKQAAAEAAPAAAATKQGMPRSKKPRKGEQQDQQQQQQQPAVDAPGKAARAAAAAAQPAAEQQQGKKVKMVKQGTAPEEAAQQQHKKPPEAKQKASAGAATGKAAAKGGKEADDARLPRTVFVGNLPATVQRKTLARLFADCGAVESVRLRSLPLKAPEAGPGGKVSKMPRRGAIASGAIDADHSAHAYVVFAEEAAVEAALALNMKEWEGHHLRVDRAAPKGEKGGVVFDPARSLFIGNLPLDVEDEALIQHFGATLVEAVRVVRDGKTGAGKGVAFVLFRTQEASKVALSQREGAQLGGRQLRVTRVSRQAGAAAGKDGKAATWQQGQAASGSGGGKGKPKNKAVHKPVAGKRKAGGKRPAVKARKQAAGMKASGGVQKRY